MKGANGMNEISNLIPLLDMHRVYEHGLTAFKLFRGWIDYTGEDIETGKQFLAVLGVIYQAGIIQGRQSD